MKRTLQSCASNTPALGRHVEILAASVRSPEEAEALPEISVAAATMHLKILKMLPESTATAGAGGIFSEDARVII